MPVLAAPRPPGEARVQRAGVFALLPALLRDFGVPPGDVFAGSGIDPATLAPGSLLPLADILAVLHRATLRTGRDDLGLLIGARFTLATHGILGRLMRHAPTLRHALLDFVRWQQGYSTASVVYLIALGDDAALGYGSDARGQPGARELHDAVVSVGVRMVHELTLGAAGAVEVLFSHRPPADTAPYDSLLRVPARFDQDQSCLILDSRSLATPLPGADTARHAALQAEIEAATQIHSTAFRLRRELRPALHRGQPSMPALARTLGLTPRTLRRRLDAEGQTFAGLRDEVRLTMACELLHLTDLPIADIALALCFASHGAFIAAFRRWTGATPSAWRDAGGILPPPPQ